MATKRLPRPRDPIALAKLIGDLLDNQGQSLAVELGPAACFVRHDVTSEADWARAVEAAEKFGGLHGLVNNAGIY